MIPERADTRHRRGRPTKSVDSWPPWKRRLHWLCHLLRPPADQGPLFWVVLVRVRSFLSFFGAKNRIHRGAITFTQFACQHQRTSEKKRPKTRKLAVVGPCRRPLFAGRDTWNKCGIARNCRR